MELADKLLTAARMFRAYDGLCGAYQAYEGATTAYDAATDLVEGAQTVRAALQPSGIEIMLERSLKR